MYHQTCLKVNPEFSHMNPEFNHFNPEFIHFNPESTTSNLESRIYKTRSGKQAAFGFNYMYMYRWSSPDYMKNNLSRLQARVILLTLQKYFLFIKIEASTIWCLTFLFPV